MPVLYQFPHVAEEEGEDEGFDMAPVHIRITHDDDLVIPQFFKVEGLGFSRSVTVGVFTSGSTMSGATGCGGSET